MKAILMHEYGNPDVLKYEEIDRPPVKPGEVLIKVHAVTINRTLDLWIREGTSGYDPQLPAILGMDSAGIVESVGEGVDGFSPGDRVTAILRPPIGNGYAEFVTASAARTFHIPDGVDYPTAAAVSRHFPMAYSLCRAANLQGGEWVLVMGAAGSLGAAAVQVAKHHGAHVIGAAGTDYRAESALKLGADACINYRASEITSTILNITGGKGVDAVFENIADPDLWPGAFNSLAKGGTLVTVGAHGGGDVMLDVRRLYRDGLTIKSGLWFSDANDANNALALTASGNYQTKIHTVLPLSKAPLAHRIAANPSTLGKVVMDPTLG